MDLRKLVEAAGVASSPNANNSARCYECHCRHTILHHVATRMGQVFPLCPLSLDRSLCTERVLSTVVTDEF